MKKYTVSYSQWRDSQLGKPLCSREAEILEWVAEGKSNAEIAEGFGLSVNTIKNSLYLAYGKLGVSSRISAVIAAGLLVRQVQRGE